MIPPHASTGRLLQITSGQRSQWKRQERFQARLYNHFYSNIPICLNLHATIQRGVHCFGWLAGLLCINADQLAPLLRRRTVQNSNIAAVRVPCMHSGSASLATHGSLGSPRAFQKNKSLQEHSALCLSLC